MSDAAVTVRRKAGRPKGSGYPTGPQRGRIFTESLHVVLNRVELDDMGRAKKNFMIIAEKLVEEAKNGEPWAIKEVMDRIEGRTPISTIQPGDEIVDDAPKVRHFKLSFVESRDE